MGKISLTVKTFDQGGDLANEYHPLRNIVDENNNLCYFDTDELNVDINNPLNIECQPSYDGTVNLIINDDKNPPRIINTRFSKLEDNRYKIINRNQLEQTNLYKLGKIDQQTRLFRNITKIPKIDLINIYNTGQLTGGNYTFYIKYADNDYNKTDIVTESGQVSIFNGFLNNVKSISGTLLNERTDKSIVLKISNIDTSFSKIYVYYVRDFSDTNGVRQTEAYILSKPYDIQSQSEIITITGYEDIEPISVEELNIKYNLVTAVKTQAQVQNMLFLGNVQGVVENIKDLQNISYFIKVGLHQTDKGIGWVSTKDYSPKEGDDINQTEYYSPNNIYYKLGYWPDELYRLGIVYIMNDDSLSSVYNLRGCEFTTFYKDGASTQETGVYDNLSSRPSDLTSLYLNNKMNYLERGGFLQKGKFLDNTFGVFKNPEAAIINYTSNDSGEVKPLYYKLELSQDILTALAKLKVKGFFIVRQKRIPTSIAQGLSIGVDSSSYIPMLKRGNNYFTESFLSKNRLLTQTYKDRLVTIPSKQCSGLLCLDANCVPTIKSDFNGGDFVLKATTTTSGTCTETDRHYTIGFTNPTLSTGKQSNVSLTYISSDVPLKYVNKYGYSTRCGSAEDVSQFSFFGKTDYSKTNYNLLRGIWTPYLGTNTSLLDNVIYTIKIPNYNSAVMKDYFSIRGKDTSPFFAITQRYSLDEIDSNNKIIVDAYRGDCYTNTVTIRMNRNFVDSEVPTTELIISPTTWKDNYKGYTNMTNDSVDDDSDKGSFASINRADLNSVNLGHWVTYKCLSNYNLGLRSEDRSHADEQSLLGSQRTFYPFNDMSPDVSHKIEESWLLNTGYSATVGQKRNFVAENVPYVKELFDNRVMFSNVQQEDAFNNSYRVFQGLDFKDIDRQYGAIVKFIPWGGNILCIFEHGVGILPINEKALIQTNTAQSIHMYGAGVLQNQITLISSDFGTIWPESIVKTPVGVYGVDTYAKKIWRYTGGNTLEIISDMKVQQFLNNNIVLSEVDKYPTIALKNVKSHYNNYKGDIMFTFYNDSKDKTWNLCFNERMAKWITRYSWTPLYSENINNIFYSLDQKRAKVLGYIYNNKNCTVGLRNNDIGTVSSSEFTVNNDTSEFSTTLSTVGYSLPTSYKYEIESIETSYLNTQDKEVEVKITDTTDINSIFTVTNNTLSTSYTKIYNYFKNLTPQIPIWFNLNIKITMYFSNSEFSIINDVLGLVINNIKLKGTDITLYEKQRNAFLRNGFYVHGKAGIFNGINYEDNNPNNEILPTKWYERQEPFEFEFVVNDQIGLHKIFDNLVIISNNVQPNEIEYEIEGDVYDFNKAGIFKSKKFDSDFDPSGTIIKDTEWNGCKFKNIQDARTFIKKLSKTTQRFTNCSINWDTTLNSYSLVTNQQCKNVVDYGRRLGNIQYKEDSWYLNIEPIKFKEKHRLYNKEKTSYIEDNWSLEKSSRIRDKYVKIRVKYTGQDLVIITALKTLYTMSYA